jgi:glycosyltransferase involved in cell wall biosynthesis
LQHLAAQTIVDELEIIVIHDGQDDEETRVVIEQWYDKLPLTYHAIVKSQQGVARNKALTYVTTDVCLIIGDDTFLDADVCERHLNFHQSSKDLRMLLGFVTWDPALEINDIMRYQEKVGWQFAYPKIAAYDGKQIPQHLQHSFTYTIHFSLPTIAFKQHLFREDVTLYGWEDMEWGMRLKQAGIPLYYDAQAKAYHHHYRSMENGLQRIRTMGKSAVMIEKIMPELNVVPRGWKRLAYEVCALLPTMDGQHRKAFLEGLKACSSEESKM